MWTDTLEPVTLDPREPSDDDDEDDGEDSQSEDEAVHILPPPSKPAKPPSPEVIDVDALPSDDDDDSEEEEEDLTLHPCSAPASRPTLVHTKSDTHIAVRGRPFRKDPPTDHRGGCQR